MFLFNALITSLAIGAFACDECYGPRNDAAHVRYVRRAQPDAQGATVAPRGPLEWGQLNFLHTTDTHAWLEGSGTSLHLVLAGPD